MDCIPAGDAMSEQVNTLAEIKAEISKKVADPATFCVHLSEGFGP